MAAPKKNTTTTTTTTTTTAKPTTDRQKWKMIFDGLRQILRNQDTHIVSLLEDRDTLKNHLQIIHDRWVSDVRLRDNRNAMLEMQILGSEMSKLVEKVKAELFVGLKKRELVISLRKLENLENELDDFKAWFDILSHRCPNQQDISSDGSSMDRCKALENEVATFKREYEKLSIEKTSSESALTSEIEFVRNQYKDMENNYNKQLLTMSNEAHEAKEEVKKLMAHIKELRSSMAEKDDTVQTLKLNITHLEGEANKKYEETTRVSKPSSSRSDLSCDSVETLKAGIYELECEVSKKDREIAQLKKELESVRSTDTTGLPTLKPCSSNPSSSKQKQNDGMVKNRARSSDLKEEANRKSEKNSPISMESRLLGSKNDADMPKRKHREVSSSSRGRESKRNKRSPASSLDQVPRRSPRKRVADAITIDTTPKLFTSQFKVPKLKSPNPLGGS